MKEYSKPVKKEIRSLISKLYERELNLELKPLDEYFEQWRKGELSPFDLSEYIHEFHQKPSRELFNKYQCSSLYDTFIAQGVVRGLLEKSEISEKTWNALEDRIEVERREWKP